ncbi:MAG: response regulator transcription factor [Campylobacterota bacterium]
MRNDLTLLYVEDDQVVRENFTEIFETYFERVITTDNGNEALKLYKKNSIDVAILDISIPGMNGLNVASKIRESDDEITLLIISAHSDKEKLLKAVNLGLFGYLVKPVTHKQLDESIQKIIKSIPSSSLLTLPKNYFWNAKESLLFYKDEDIKLTKNETKIIQTMIENKNKYLTACDIQENIFDTNESSDSKCNNVVQLISRLRKKIFKRFNTEDYFIENCYGTGYKIIVSS